VLYQTVTLLVTLGDPTTNSTFALPFFIVVELENAVAWWIHNILLLSLCAAW